MEVDLVAWKRSDGKWRRELETREKMLEGLKAHHSKQSATIYKLKEDVVHLQHEILERDDKIKYMSEEVEAEKRERLDAQECARLDRLATQSLKAKLKEEQLAHQKLKKEVAREALEAERQQESSLSEMQALQGRLSYLEFEVHRVEVVEKYHDSPLGKIEMALACKAGFDYLLELIPRESRPNPDHLHYPSRVTTCLNVLKEIERKGGVLVLDVDNGDEGVEESEEGSARDSWVS